ncbi:MAG: TetR/AcrR family transcriptional regulator [Pseudomonadota bacterium]
MSVTDPQQTATGRVPRTSKGRARVDLLKLTAARQIAENGYESATMTAIAEGAGASIGSLYQYFPTKDHLVREIQTDALEVLVTSLSALAQAGGPPEKIGAAVFDCLTDHARENPAFRAVCERRDISATERRTVRDRICAHIAEGLTRASPPLPASRAMVAATLILHLTDAVDGPGKLTHPVAQPLMRDEIHRMLRLYFEAPE